MHRAPIVLLSTIAGTAGVLGFHVHSPAVQTAAASTPAATSTATPTSTASSSSTSKTVSGTATGDAVDTRYGAAQVRVTVKDGKIVSVEAVGLQSGDPPS